ncbi:MAG: membrane protein insertase YidC, partial [Planctomycetes bacterium]|nr:membrane protein insertase YidC [Planctomycetota bacterium]
DKAGHYKAQIIFDSHTGGIQSVALSEHKLNVTDEETGYPLLEGVEDLQGLNLDSLMLGILKLKDRDEVFDLSVDCWQQGSFETDSEGRQSISYTATIVDERGQRVLEVVRRYSNQASSEDSDEGYELDFEIHLINKSGQDIKMAELELIGPLGVRREDPRYDRRQVLVAYRDPDGEVNIEKHQMQRSKNGELAILEKPGPTDRLIWYAVGNKFFTAVVRPLPQNQGGWVDYIQYGQVKVETIQSQIPGESLDDMPFENKTVGVRTTLVANQPLGPNGELVYQFKIYLGAIDTDLFRGETYAGLHYTKLLNTYACTFCVFDWLTTLLLKMMKGIYLGVHNYGVAIIILVLMVRFVLHPVTKKSQISMMAMSKMAPKAAEIKKKYEGNKEEIQKRTMALYKEHGANPLLGCLPMLLQMPIWMALFTVVDANVALRHEGLFPAGWHWITDLSAPDRLIPFEWIGIPSFTLPLMIGFVDSINLLPFLLGLAMYLQTKLSGQNTMAANNPQMAQQQKMMQILMPIMMLVFLYSAPSGLNLYIMASTFGGILEQYYIRKHIRKDEAKEAAVTVSTTKKVGVKLAPKKKKPKPPMRYR